MVPQFIRELVSFVAAGILCVLPLVELRQLPPIFEDSPMISAADDHWFPTIAVVEPRVEFRLIRVSRPKRREDSEAARPAWLALGLVVLVSLYIYQYHQPHTITIP